MSDYPYPGDDPATLASMSSTFDANVTNMHTLIGAVNNAESNIQGNWKGDTATAASGDIAKINKVLALTATDFKTSKSALDALHDALVPIRHQVDELRRQLATAQRTLTGEQEQYGRAARFGEANDMTPAEVTQYRTTIAGQETKTQGDITNLDNEYAALVRKANTATDTCSDALKATISGSTYDPNTSGVKGTNLDDILQLDGLSLLHRYQAGQDATKAAADSKKLLTLEPGSPEAVKLAHELAGLLHKYPDGDPDFSVPYLKQVGQEDLLRLTVYVAGLQDTGGDGKALGQDIGEIQRDLGSDLAAATHLLGKPNPNQTQQLDQTWVDALLKDGGKGYQTSVGGYYYDIKGFQSLGILLRTGDYGSTFLSESGGALMDYEKSYPDDDLKSNTWLDLGADVTPNLRLWWGAGDGNNVERGLDPFNGWVAGMQNSSEAKQVLYDDVTAGPNSYNNHGLLNYLLNDRDWSLRDVNTKPSIMGHFDSGETQVGLVDLGRMLDHTVQGSAHDPQSQAIFKSMIHDLGDKDLNHRIGADDGFKHTDWIPPELRAGVGDIVAKNIDLTHNTLARAYPTGINEEELKRVLMDEGKDHDGPGGGAMGTIKAAESSYARTLIAAKLDENPPDMTYKADGAGIARLYSGLDFGKDVQASTAQQDADADHNASVDEWVGDVSSVVSLGTDKLTEDIPGGSLVTGWAMDHAIDGIKDSLYQDHSGATEAANADSDYASQQTYDSTVRQSAALAYLTPTELQAHGLLDANGHIITLDDQGAQSAGWTWAMNKMRADGHSDVLNLPSDGETGYEANYSKDASTYLHS